MLGKLGAVTEDPSQKRTTPRVDVTLKVALQYPDRETFVERFSINVSKTGLFVRARDPAPVGSRVRFEYRLKDDSRILRGTGIVRWARAAAQAQEPDSPPGMGIEFVDLDPQSEELVNLIVAQRGEGERATRKATPRPRVGALGEGDPNAPREVPQLDAEEEELLSGLELGGAPAKIRDDVPVPTEAPPPVSASADIDPFDALDALVDETLPPPAAAAVKATDTPHVVIDLAGSCILATLLVPGREHPDHFDERKLELTASINDGKLMLGQSGTATRALYAWADTKTTLRNRLAAETYGLALTRDQAGRPMVSIEGTSVALIDLAVAAAKYTIDAYREQLASTPVFRIVVPATMSAAVRSELKGLALSASANAQLTDDVVTLAAVARQDEAVVISMSDFETRIGRVSGSTTTQVVTADGLAEIDQLVAQATARALLKEHGIDADDDPSLREALDTQVRLARKDGSGNDWHVSIAGASVTMTQAEIAKAVEPALRRIAIAADAVRAGAVIVLASDDPLWPGVTSRFEALLGPLESLEPSPWLRING